MRKIKLKRQKSGFTLVELSFAITFITTLLLIFALLTNNIINSYKKGLVIRSVNSTGRDLIDDIKSSISSAPSATVESLCSIFEDKSDEKNWKTQCKNDNASLLRYVSFSDNFTLKGNTEKSDIKVSAVFCTGSYSYVWNSGYFYDDNNSPNNQYKIKIGNTVYRFAKVIDPNASFCKSALKTEDDTLIYAKAERVELKTNNDITELLPPNDNIELLLYDFSMFSPTQNDDTRRALYSGSFVLGSKTGGINITRKGNYCDIENSEISDLNNCAINKFNFTMRTEGE